MSTPTARELLAQYEAALSALIDRGVIRTRNAVGDIGEAIAAATYGGKLEKNSNAGFDFLSPDGRRFQVKTRVIRPGYSQATIFKNWDFDVAVLIGLSREDYGIVWAREVDVVETRALARGGLRFNVTQGAKAGMDVTARLRDAYAKL
ncbi:DUF6998 domain-containing protein [Pseudolysinimonas yzui]|uniref:DUF6998 domain-containing protein n=1 Tax=Pseudolysinimonas yzui TaxID=2708254 RepID=A0A8J3GQ91_9MICO|nr:hypothetical protein [Pseudolysinimonas yzui]GHF14824.1 hypothetical protein GCM10011600_14730 [Pseudolysinimonas yzui]